MRKARSGGAKSGASRRKLKHVAAEQAYQLLEPRKLLAGTHDAQILASITQALLPSTASGFTAFTNRLKDNAVLSKALPLVNRGIGDNVVPKAAFDSLLSRLGGSYASVGALGNALEGSGGIGDGVQVLATRDNTDNVEYDLRLVTSSTISVPLSSVFGDLDFAASGSISLSVNFDFRATVGAQWDGSSAVFYVADNNESLKVSASINSTNITAAARLGFLDVNLSNVNLAFSPTFNINLVDPGSAGGSGRVTLNELNGSSVSTLLPTTVTAGATTSFSATLGTSGAIGLGSTTFTGTWGDINNLGSFSSNLSSLGSYNQLANLSPATLIAGFQKVVSYIGAADGLSGFGRPLPIIGDQWADVLDLPGFLNQRLVTSIGSYNSVETLLARLAAQSGFSNVGVNVSGGALTYTLDLGLSRSTSIPLELSLADLPLRLEGGAVGVSATANGKLKFGVDLASRNFFLADDVSGPEFSATATINANNINASGGIGFISAQVTGGQAKLNLTGTLDLDKDGGNRFSLADLSDGEAVAGSTHFAMAGNASGSLPISSALLGLSSKTFTFNWANLNDPGTFSSNLADFDDFNGFDKLDSFDAAGGIDALVDLLTSVTGQANSPFAKKLPLVNKSLAEIVDFASLLSQLANNGGVGGTSSNPTTPFNNSDQLLQQLRNIAGVGAANASYALVGGNLEYTVHMDRTVTKTVPIDLNLDADVLDLSVNGNATVTLDTDLDIKFGLTPAGQFYVVQSASPNFKATGSITLNAAAAARLGFIDVTVSGATASFGANASVRLLDPGTSDPPTPGKIVQSEFNFGNLGSMATVSLTGSASATLPLTTNVSGVSGGTLVLNWPDITDIDSVNVNTSGVSLMSDFDNVDPADFIDGLNIVPNLLNLLKGSSFFGKSIGLLGGNLGNIADLSARFTTALNQFKSASSNYATAQRVAQFLGSALTSATGGAVNVATSINGGDVRFVFTFAESLNGKQIPIGFSVPVGPASFNLGANASLSGSASATLTLGMRLGDGIADKDRFYIAPGSASGAQVAAKIGVSNLTANATLGYFSVGVTNGTANIAGRTGGVIDTAKNATIGLQLVDPNSDGRISMSELTGNLSTVLGAVTADAAANLTLPITSGLPSGQGANPIVQVIWNDLFGGTPTVTTPDLTNLVGADVFNFGSISQGIQSVITMIQSLTANSLMQTKIPLIDVKLSDVFNYVQDAIQFWNTISASQSTPQAFANAVAAADAAIPFITITPSSNTALHNPAQSKFYYTLDLDKTFANVDKAFKFGGGLFSLNGMVHTGLHLTQHLEWGMNPIDGFFIKENASLNAAATLSATFDKIGGQFGLLKFGVKNGSGNVNFGASVNAVDADADDFIKLDQLKSNLFGILNFGLGGTGALDLPIGAHLGDTGPGVKTEFRMYWDAAQPTSFHFAPADRGSTPITSLSTDPTDGFAPIQFEIGEWISDLVGPFVRKIGEYNPLRPELVDFLNTKLPIIGKTPFQLLATQLDSSTADAIQLLLNIASVVNNVSGVVGQGKSLDLTQYFPTAPAAGDGSSLPAGPGSTDGGIGLISGLADILRTLRDEYSIQLLALDPDHLGSSITSAAISMFMGKDVDLIRWNPDPLRASFPINTPEFPIAAIAVGPIVGTITGQIKASVGFFADPDFGFSSRGLRDLDGDGSTDFLDGFFIGDNIENLGQSNQNDPFEVGGFAEVGLVIKGRVTLLGLIGAGIEGGGGITGTIGLDITDVKYSGGTPALPTGRVERKQTGGDNRIYFDELEYLFANYPITCVLHLGGTLGAYVEFGVFITVFGFDVDVFHTRQDFELFNFDVPCGDPPSSDTASVSGTTWTVNQSSSKYDTSIRFDQIYDDKQRLTGFRVSRDRKAGDYTRVIDSLLSGSAANQVDIYGNTLSVGTKARLSTDGKVYELVQPNPFFGGPVQWQLAKDGSVPDSFHVDGTHDFEDFTLIDPSSPNYIGNVTTLIINGADGGDTVRLNPHLTDTLATIASGGGTGELRIRNIVFNGFGGADSIDLTELDASTSNLIAATLDGGAGDDTLRGGFRGDSIVGGAGKDSIDGSGANDTISGGDDADTIVGGGGDDSIDGGAGDDRLLATSGRDTLYGGEGNDCLLGGTGADCLLGAAGNDSIAGGSGADTIYAGSGNDLVDAGEDNDYIQGEADNDTIMGGAGDDLIDGGSGNDSLSGDDGFDVVLESTAGDVVATDSVITGAGTDTLANGVERVRIVGSGANERFTVSGWTRGVLAIDGAGGVDTVTSSGVDFVLDNNSLTRDGVNFTLLNIEAMDLTGTDPRLNSFDIGIFTGGGTLTGNGSADTVIMRGLGNATLTNAALTRSIGTSLNLAGIERAKLLGGADSNNFVASVFTGNVTLLGNGGDDTLVGGSGDDCIDGGAGNDSISGNAGDDLLLGGGGLSTIDGGDGDDVIRGSDDARDQITAGIGRDYILGNGGNDSIDAGVGDDTVLGGAGDDTISGQAGKDLLVGGADHDVLYGHNAAGTGDDAAVDTLYGDFATNRSTSDNGDAGTPGRDCLYGGGGNDLIFGEGDDDYISGGGGASNYVDYGSGEAATQSDFVAPSSTPAPTIGSVPVAYDGPTLPIGPTTTQRWGELSGSAGTFGVSGGAGVSTDVAVANGSTGTFLAWADNRTGNWEIYVARHNGSGWVTLGTSASGTGVSNSPTVDSRRPAIAVDASGNPIVAWTELTASGKKINVARWNGTSWVALGNSLGGSGIASATNADRAAVVYRGSTPVVGYINEDGTDQANVLQFSGSAWVAYGSGAPTHSTASDAADLSLATDGTNVAIAYRLGGDVFVRQSNGGAWSTLGGAAVVANSGNSSTPSLAYASSGLFVAWADDTSGHSEIYAARYNGSVWASLGASSFSGGGVSNTGGTATKPVLAASGANVSLAWIDDQTAARTGSFTAVFAKRFDGTRFVEQAIGDAQRRGIHGKYADPTGVAIAMSATGQPIVAWSDRADGREGIKLRINTTPALGTAYYVNDNSNVADVYTLAPGSDSAAGTGADAPISGVQKLLDTTTIAAGSVIYLDAGTYSAFTVNKPGVRIVGAPGGATRIKGLINVTAANVVFENIDVDNLTFAGSATGGGLFNSWVRGVLTSSAASVQIAHNRVDGAVNINGGSNVLVSSNERNGASGATGFSLSGVTNLTLRDNVIRGGSVGIQISSASGGTIEANDVGGAGTGLDVNAAFTGPIRFNRFHDGSTGVRYAAAADLSSNLVYANGVGVASSIVGQTNSLGSVGTSDANFIFRNTTGATLGNGAMRKQNVFGNDTGVSGTGTLGGTVAADANTIEYNGIGASFGGTIQFNRIGLNGVGIAPTSKTLIHHNVLYRNTTAGISASGASGLQIVSNTIYNKSGDAVKLAGNSNSAELRNNILWADGAGGYALNIADDASRTSFFSDYNSLIAGSGAGGVVYYSKPFTDLIDWQRDVNRYDLHSVGTTSVDPSRATPRFGSLGTNDLTLFAPIGGRRESNAAVDVADTLTDIGLDRNVANLLTNPSFESGLSGWTASQNAGVGNSSPWSGSSYFSAGSIQIGFVEQTVPISATGLSAAQIDTADYVLIAGGRFKSAAEDPMDGGKLIIRFLDGSSNVIGSFTVNPGKTNDRWQLDGGRFQIPSGTRSITYRFESTRVTGSTSDAFLDGAFMRVEPETAAYDQGAFGQTTADTTDPQSARLYVRYPDMYQDLELGKPVTVRWESFGNSGEKPIRIDLYRDGADGPALFTTLTASTADDGEFIFTPGDFGLNYGDRGLRIQVSFVGDPFTFDRSIEASTVPENGNQYFIDDASNANDQYTPTATGNNRNTGKTASAPKPLLTTLLRAYDLGAGDVVNVDTGTYGHFDNVVLSGNLDLGDDEGAVYTGPTAAGKTATLVHYFPQTGNLFELNDGDFTTIQHFVLQGARRGIWARNDSTALTVNDVTVSNTALEGIRLENDSADANLTQVSVSNAGADGVYSGVRLSSISGGTFSNNAGTGINLANGADLIENNIVQGNAQYGIYISNGPANAIIRNNLITGSGQWGLYVQNTGGTTAVTGNRVSGNGSGIYFYSGSTGGTISGNTVSNHAGFNAVGIAAQANVDVNGNVLSNNTVGVDLGVYGSATVRNNRITGSSNAGIRGYSGGGKVISGNVLAGNTIGIDAYWDASGGSISNNVFSNHGVAAIRFSGAGGGTITNNTFYEPTADGVRLESNTRNVTLRNNAIWVLAGVGINVASNSQNGFASDYNLLYATGSGAIGSWQGVSRSTLAAWRSATFGDVNSLSANPQFIDVDGADNVLGNSDDDLHLSTPYGYNAGGSLAPVLNTTTGLPVAAPGTLTTNAGLPFSPGIDRGDPTSSYANEPVPNGSVINLGAYGNTTQAERSPGQYLLVTSPNGGETWSANQSFPIRWNSHSFTGTVNIVLIRDSNAGFQQTIASGVANNGQYTWIVPAGITPGTDYRIRIVRNDVAVSDVSDAPFELTGPINVYYVNDNSTAGDVFTSAVGNDANAGTSPNAPKASIAAILAAYDLGPGDIIRVDTGRYVLTTNIVIGANDAGVTIEGPSGVLDSSAQYADVVAADAPTFNQPAGGAGGAAGAFEGAANQSTSYNGSTSTTLSGVGTSGTTRSFEVWFKPGTLSGQQYLFSQAYTDSRGTASTSDDYNQRYINLYLSGGTVYFDALIRKLNGGTGQYDLTSASTYGSGVRAGEWNHVLVTFDGNAANALKIYVNGSLANQTGAVPAGYTEIGPGSNAGTVRGALGADRYDPATPATYFNGNLQAFAVYGSALSSDRAAQHFGAGSGRQRRAVLDRANANSGSYAFELQNADDVTLRQLQITGAYAGVFASSSSDSDHVTLQGLSLFANNVAGIDLEAGNDFATVAGSDFTGVLGGINGTDNQNYHIVANGSDALISDNQLRGGNQYGIYVTQPRTIVRQNTISGIDGTGIYAYYGNYLSASDAILVQQNDVSGFTSYGIAAYYSVRVEGNTVHDARGNGTGIGVSGPRYDVINNVVMRNRIGIDTSQPYGAAIRNNRVFANDLYGIQTYGIDLVGNTLYSNGAAAGGAAINEYSWGSTAPRISNNLIYASGGTSLRLNSGSTVVENNTFRESSGDLIVLNGAPSTTLRNNLFVHTGTGRVINVSADSQAGFASNYNVFYLPAGAAVALWQGVAYADLNAWDYELGFDSASRIANPQFVDPDGADNILGYAGGVDGGLDDNFNVTSNSPVIDAGDPVSYHYMEPAPNGDRVNVGHLGNTPNANTSPSPMVQVLAPNGREKLTVGTPFPIQFRSSGLTLQRPVLQTNFGGGRIGSFEYGLPVANAYLNGFSGTVSTAGVPNAGPADLYKTWIQNNDGAVGAVMSIPIKVPDGTYTLRLHFADTQGPGVRKFDIGVNGTVLVSNFDASAAAGGFSKATTLDITATASGGNGLVLQLTNKLYVAMLNGLEIYANNAGGSADPRFNLEVSTNGGSSWSTIASNVGVNALGNGSVTWTPTTPGATALVRVTSVETGVSDISDVPFLVADSGNAYYINDGSTAGDVYTSAVGNNANSGKSASSPMASLASLLARYDLGPGDVIYIDSGDYSLLSNLVIDASDAGVELRGAGGSVILSQTARSAVIADAPTGYWRLGESTGSTAASQTGGGSGGYLGGVTLGQGGAFANSPLTSAAFDGVDDRLQLSDASLNLTGNTLSLAAWVNPTFTSGQQFVIGRAGGTGSGTWQYSLYLYDGNVGIRLRNSAGQTFDVVAYGSNIPANAWSRIAMTYDGSKVRAFANDRLLNTWDFTGNLAGNASLSTYVGQAFEGATSQRFAGRIQDVLISDSAIPQGRVIEQYLSAVRQRGLTQFNRGNTTTGSNAIELVNADGTKITGLTITGANIGIYVAGASDSDNVTLDNVTITANRSSGVHVESSNDFFTITNSTITGVASGSDQTGQDENVYFYYVDHLTVTNNTLGNSDYHGLYATGLTNALIDGNTVLHTGQYGIHADGNNAASPNVVSNNNVTGSLGTGIDASGWVNVVNNTVRGRPTGIAAINNAAVRNNVVSGATNGIYSRFATIVDGNRAYNNTTGILNDGGGAVIRGNRLYNNGTGLWMNEWGSTSGGWVENNVLYNNTVRGARLTSGVGMAFVNNTIYESSNGVLIDGVNGSDLKLRSNLFAISGGRAIEVAPEAQRGVSSDYNLFSLTGSATLARWQNVDLTSADAWFYRVGMDGNSLYTDPKFADVDGADNVLGYVGGVDRGADDTFSFQSNTPTIDAGDPFGYYLREQGGGGGRVNIGHLGNTVAAPLATAGRSVRVVTPNGKNKFETGSTQKVSFETTGILPQQVVAQVKMGSTGLNGYWLGDRFGVTNNQLVNSSDPVDTSGVAAAPAADFYSSYVTNYYDGKAQWQFPVADGTYSITLHFNEPNASGVNQRKFDVALNGAVVRPDLDLFAQAGGRNKAFTLTFNVDATGGGGIDLSLINKVSYALLYGVEIFRTGMNAANSKTASVALSTNAGATYTTLATGLTLDRFGRGSYNWNVTQAPTDDGLLRVTGDEPGVAADTSDDTIQIVNNGTSYYINNGSTTGDVFTTATGNDRNDGKSPDRPMATLSALLAAYDLDAGDTIYVDAGSYVLLQNVLMSLEDAGVKIKGAGRDLTIFDRANTAAQRYSFVFTGGADGVAIDSLGMTNGYGGVWSDTAASDNVTLSNVKIFANANTGVYLNSNGQGAASNDNWTIRNADIYGVPGGTSADDQLYGIYVNNGSGLLVQDSALHDHYNQGVYGYYTNVVARHNQVYGNSIGISVNGASANNRATIVDNDIYGNVQYGVQMNGSVDVTGNRIRGQTGVNHAGVVGSSSNSSITGNVIWNNWRGVDTQYLDRIANNRVYFNADIGIANHGGTGTIDGNQVYSNSVGISTTVSYPDYFGRIQNNLVYANTNRGIEVIYSYPGYVNGATLANNTVYQPVGDAIYVSSAPGVKLRNNIIYVGNGYGIRVADTQSQTGFTSDRNVIQLSSDPNASVGYWNGIRRATLADWRTATAGDAASTLADPKFVDIDGADNVLGYSTAGAGYDGGKDDNFYVLKNSPAIDRGEAVTGSHFDFEGQTRADDSATSNAGTSDYVEQPQGSSSFAVVGTAQNWRSSNGWWTLNLPFSFNYYGTAYTQAIVTSEGYIQLGTTGNFNPAQPQAAGSLGKGPRIAVLWDNLTTGNAGNDIYVQSTVANQVTIRWAASLESTGTPVNASMTLFSNGNIRFDYGDGNTGLSSPVLGLGSDAFPVTPQIGDAYVLSSRSGNSVLTNAGSALFSTVPGFRDIGAFEFRGTSNDSTPPTITSSVPVAVHGSGTATSVSQITLNFSEPINRIDGQAVAAYQLIGAGPDNTFGTVDDVTYGVTPQYVDGSTQATLAIDAGSLPVGKYRLTVVGNAFTSTGLHDLSGLLFDGDANGAEGGNYVREFIVGSDATPPSVSGMVFDYGSAQHAVKVTFSENVGPSLSLADIQIISLATGLPIDPASLALSYDTSTNVATITFPGLASQRLPKGQYRMTITASGVSDAAANTMASNYVKQFFFMPGDLDGNGTVGFSDLLQLAKNYNKPGTYASGDVNYDGVVNFADLLQLAKSYNQTVLDTVAPSIASSTFEYANPHHAMTVQFSENVGASLSIADIEVRNTQTNAVIPAASMAMSFDPATNRMTLTFPGLANQRLPQGSYRLTIFGAGVTDAAGNALASNYQKAFKFAAGDLDGDGTVAFADLLSLAKNYGKTGMTYLQGDADYDGAVTFNDLLIVAKNYGLTLPAGATPEEVLGLIATIDANAQQTPPSSGAPTRTRSDAAPRSSAAAAASVATVQTVAPDVFAEASRPTTSRRRKDATGDLLV